MKKIAFNIGEKTIGDSSCLIQSMSDKKTEYVDYNVSLTNKLAKMGLDLMRFSILDKKDALSLNEIKKRVTIPIIADIHYDYRLALLAVASGADKIRINPANIKNPDHLLAIIKACKEKDIPIRIGINTGSYSSSITIESILADLDSVLGIFKSEDFEKIVLSIKASDPTLSRILYRCLSEKFAYPIHIGLTESGLLNSGLIRSTYALAPLLEEGIGDTLRISLASDRKEEVRACKELLKLTGRKRDVPTLICCPTCGRTSEDLSKLREIVQNHLDCVFKDITVALMGCPVNGIGEGKEADVGLTLSGERDKYILFKKGESLGVFTKEEALVKLFDFIDGYSM